MNQDEFGGVAVEAPTADEFGGEPVMAAADEFGGVPIQAATPAPVPETVGTVRGLAASVERGFMRMQGLPDVLAATTMRDAAKPTVRQERKAYVAAMSDPRYMQAAMEDPARAESMFGPAAKLDTAMQPARMMQQFIAEDVAANEAAIAALPQSEAQRDLATTDDKWAAWKKNPIELTASIALESLPPSIVGAVAGTAVGGPGVGTALGAGASSGLLTFSSELLGEAGKAGYDVQDAAQLQAFLNDAPAFDRAINTAVTKAGIVGPVDAGTAGVAGRFLGPALKQGLRQTLFASGKELGMQMAGGAGGEALAQLASGQPLDTFDISMEGIAELGSAPVEIASNLRAAAKAAPTKPVIPSARPATFFSEFGDEAKATEVVTAPGPSSADVTKTPTSEGANAGARPDLQAMPAEQTTVPELPATLHGQVVKMRAGKAPAVLFTPADTIPEWALQDERFEVVETPEGRIMFDTAAWTKDQITQLVSAGQMGTVLGYGVADRPAQATAVVTVRDKAGLELRAVGVTEATLPTVLAAAQRYADAGDVVAVEAPADVIAKRLDGAGAGATVRTADATAQSAAYLEGKRYREAQARQAAQQLSAAGASQSDVVRTTEAEAAPAAGLPEDKVVTMEGIDRQTGDIVEREMPAAKAGKWLEGRMDILRQLLDCLGKA